MITDLASIEQELRRQRVEGVTSATGTSQIVTDAAISFSDITTNDFSTAKHGFVPKGTNVGSFLKDDGTWSSPSGSGDVIGPASAVNDKVVLFNGATGKAIKDSGLSLSGTNTGDQDLSGYATVGLAAGLAIALG